MNKPRISIAICLTALTIAACTDGGGKVTGTGGSTSKPVPATVNVGDRERFVTPPGFDDVITFCSYGVRIWVGDASDGQSSLTSQTGAGCS